VPAGEIVVTGVVTLPVEQAFTAFTEDIDRWWQRPAGRGGDAIIRFESDQLVSVSASGSQVLAAVTSWNPPRRLDLEWRGPHARPGDGVVVEFDPEPPGTRVTIHHQRRGISPQAVEAAVVALWWGDLLGRLVGGRRP
jgi:uncharacterized protein YndB with AHSA1/START domain